MQTTSLLRAIQKTGSSIIILMMMFSQFTGAVSPARADSTNPPVISQGASTLMNVEENSSANNLTLHATGAQGATLTWSISTPASYGAVAVAHPATGHTISINYIPRSDYVGSDSFIVQVEDGNGGTATITIEVTINPGIAADSLVPGQVTGGTINPSDTEADMLLVSVGTGGTPGNGGSDYPSISADGSIVVFESKATNLVSGDTNDAYDIFAYDRQAGEMRRVSVASDSAQGNSDSYDSSVSADGRYVVFSSTASNLVGEDTNDSLDIFVHDLLTDGTTRVSVASDGTQGNGDSDYPVISADGRYVAFESYATNLVNGDTNDTKDIFIHDRQTGETRRLSLASDGTQGNGDSEYPSISANGRYVAFESNASNLVSGDTNNAFDIFFHDLQTGETTRLSLASNGTQGNGDSDSPSISANGRYVTFESNASNLVNGDTNNAFDIFTHDRQTGNTTRVSLASAGAQGNGDSYDSSISTAGRYVAFVSYASNLISGVTNGMSEIYFHDLQTGETSGVSLATDGAQGNGQSIYASISAGGGYVAFSSFSTNLVSQETNGISNIFVRDMHTSDAGSGGNTPPVITEGDSSSVTMSQNGSPIDFALTLHATDVDGDELTWSIGTAASQGTATVTGTGYSKDISYSPNTGYTGPDSFVVQVDDGNGGTDTITVNVNVVQPTASLKIRDDYDGDGKTDPAIFDPATGIAWWMKSSTGLWDGIWLGSDTFSYIGASDFDGDGKTDPAKFYPATGTVWWVNSSTGLLDGQWLGPDLFQYVTGSDFDGDGKADPAKFYPETGTVWWVKSTTGKLDGQWLGADSFQYVTGSDFDGDGKTDPAKFYPSTGTVWWVKSTTHTIDGMWLGPDSFQYVPASDFDGDHKTDPAKFYPDTGTLWWVRSSDGVMDGAWLGPGTYTLIAGCDFNGDGKTDPAKYDATTHTLSWLDTTTGLWTDVDMGPGAYTVVNGQ